ncbi:polysaccharide deacetylase family protein [Thiolapillus sp.]
MNYHRVYHNQLATEFDSGVFCPSKEEFDQQMAFLSKHTNLMTEEEIVRLAQSGKPPPKRSALVTFDDGYRDNYLFAVPVLRKYSVPAIFFIPIESIEKSRLGWWDIIAYFIKHTEKEVLPFKGDELFLRTETEKQNAIGILQDYMKLVRSEESQDLLAELSFLCGVDFPSKEIQREELMNWDQIMEIGNTEFLSIGSHTVSHRVLSTVSGEDELQELTDSRLFLQQKLGREIKSVAYPVGSYRTFSDRTKSNAHRAGYSIGFSFNTGVNYGSIADPFNIKRIGPVADLSIFKSMLIVPRLFVSELT